MDRIFNPKLNRIDSLIVVPLYGNQDRLSPLAGVLSSRYYHLNSLLYQLLYQTNLGSRYRKCIQYYINLKINHSHNDKKIKVLYQLITINQIY